VLAVLQLLKFNRSGFAIVIPGSFPTLI
jgi:hypothetical protein